MAPLRAGDVVVTDSAAPRGVAKVLAPATVRVARPGGRADLPAG
jgi:hypothetical protein